MLAGDRIVGERLDALYAGDSMLVRVRIAEFPRIRDESVSLLVEPVDDHRVPPRVRISWFSPPIVPLLGEVWELELRLVRPRGSANPGVFDYETWLFRERVHATGYIVPSKRNRLLWSGTASSADNLRSRFIAIARAASESDQAAAVLAAIATGERHLVTRAQWDAFAATGTTHLMAISGLHIGLAALFAFSIAYALAVPVPGNRLVVALVAGVVAAAVYAWISGSGVPARRAVLMLALTAATVARRRQVDIGVVVAVAALVVFVTDPIATLAPGFHLSFAAVILLLWLSRRRDVDCMGRSPIRGMRRLFVLQVFLLFGLLPLSALIFQRFSLVATPVNVVAVPVFSFVTAPLTLAGLALFELTEAGAMLFLEFAAHSVDGLEGLVQRAMHLPLAHFNLPRLTGGACLLLLVPLAWAVLPVGWPARRIAVLGVVAIVTWRPSPPPAECFDAWVLDVGQGLAVVVETHHDTMLYDTGMAWRSGESVAGQTIVPFLRSRGIRRIDRLVASHADLDHSGGVGEMLTAFDVGHLIVGEPLDGLAAWHCGAGQTWWSGAIRFEILHPSPADERNGNDASCVVRVSAGPHALLLTGDIEAAAERQLIQRRAMLGADVVVVPHHGSLTSSSVPFVASVHADVAVVSAAYGNRWGFPKDIVVERWQSQGAEVLNTADHGAVYVRACATGGVVEMRLEREERRRFWHAGR